jgi:uncharacterized protein YecE (DUF72 family)
VASVLASFDISMVVADPAPVADASLPSSPPTLVYFRWHGSPRVYWSRYGEEAIAALAGRVRSLAVANSVWCVFDNTASGAAIENA